MKQPFRKVEEVDENENKEEEKPKESDDDDSNDNSTDNDDVKVEDDNTEWYMPWNLILCYFLLII